MEKAKCETPGAVVVEVLSCSPAKIAASSPLVAPTDTPLVSLPTSSCSDDDDNLLLCLEEVDDSSEENIEEENLSESQPQSVVIADADSSFTQYCGYIPSTPSNAMLFSPSTPWLSSSSPQIASVFTANFSPPMQPLQPQNTPKLHHLSPPSSAPIVSSSVYSPFPNSPCFLPMYNYEEGGEFYWIQGDPVNQQ